MPSLRDELLQRLEQSSRDYDQPSLADQAPLDRPEDPEQDEQSALAEMERTEPFPLPNQEPATVSGETAAMTQPDMEAPPEAAGLEVPPPPDRPDEPPAMDAQVVPEVQGEAAQEPEGAASTPPVPSISPPPDRPYVDESRFESPQGAPEISSEAFVADQGEAQGGLDGPGAMQGGPQQPMGQMLGRLSEQQMAGMAVAAAEGFHRGMMVFQQHFDQRLAELNRGQSF